MIDMAVLEKGTFVQQILKLDEIEKSGDASALPHLCALYGKSGLDDSLRQALGDTIRSLYANNPSRIIETLSGPDLPERKIAILLCGQLALKEAHGPLCALARELKPGDDLVQVFSALGKVADESTLPVFREGAKCPDPFVTSQSISQLGAQKDASSVGFLKSILAEAEADDKYETCSLVTAAAIEALNGIGTREAIYALVAIIHHRNPTVRTIVHRLLVERGEEVVEAIGRFLDDGDTDEKIMAAGLLGLIGSPKGAELMLAAMDRGKLGDLNVRFAVYDAFGLIPSLKTMICLVDALDEKDEMTLVAVATSLNRMVNPGVIARVGMALSGGGEKAAAVARAIISAQAMELFKALYGSPEASKPIIEQLMSTRDQTARGVFISALDMLGGERASADSARLAKPEETEKKRRILVVDDSRSIIMFYRAVLSEMGLDVVTAGHGKAALAVLDKDFAFDLIITDMNMPEMNGVELTRKIKENFMYSSIPVVMATTEADESQKSMADRAGVSGYLVKPIKPEALSELLAGMFG